MPPKHVEERVSHAARPEVVGSLPRSLYLETTNRCDSKCETCVRTFFTNEPAKDLSLAEVRRIAEQFPVLDRVVLHGIGEPLLNRDIFDIIAYLKGRGAYVLFNSDAISLNAARAAKLIASGLDEYRVSVDSATRPTYLAIRGVDQFERVTANVAHLRREQARLGCERPAVSLWFVAARANLHELGELVLLAERIGVGEVYLQRLVTTSAGRAGLGVAVDEQSLRGSLEEEQERLIQDAERLAGERGIQFRASGLTTPLESLRMPEDRHRYWAGCQRPWTLSYVTANGNVFPCCIAPCTARDYRGAILGNALEQDFASIWDGERYRQFRRRFEGDEPPDPCEGCGLKWSY
jgi:MoaA/NifB/PqqE/SkfB family radical SAM enzyme